MSRGRECGLRREQSNNRGSVKASVREASKYVLYAICISSRCRFSFPDIQQSGVNRLTERFGDCIFPCSAEGLRTAKLEFKPWRTGTIADPNGSGELNAKKSPSVKARLR